MKIREATLDDSKSIVRLIEPMWMDHVVNHPGIMRKDELSKFDANKYVTTHIKSDNSAFFVATEKELMIGCIRIEKIKHDPLIGDDFVGYIDDLVVENKFQKRGVATKLQKVAENWAKKKQLNVLKIRVYDFNKPSIYFCKKVGFESLYHELFKKVT